MIQLGLILVGVFSLEIGLTRIAHPGMRRAGQVLLVLTAAAVLLVLAYGLSAWLSIAPGD